MRPNPVKAALASGGRAFGAMVFEFFTPGMAQVMAVAGAEFAVWDTEHSGVGIETIKAQMAFARGTTCTPFVRVGSHEPHAIAAALDAGAFGIMAPMVETAAQAGALVASTRYAPAGHRGAAFGVAHDDYRPGPPAEKVRLAHERTLVIAMVETAEGVANVDAIAAVPGIDVLWLGHFDLTNSMGIPGQFTHPDFQVAIEAIAAAAARHGKTAAMMAADEAWAARFLALGYRMVAYGIDHLVYQAALARGIAAMRAMAPGTESP